MSMVIVSFVQSIAISKRFAYKHGYEIDPSQELISLGVANLVGAVFQASPTTGAIGQSAVNDEIGAVTGVAGLVTGLLVMLVLLVLTPVFEKMPLAVLASIVMAFVTGMFVSSLCTTNASRLVSERLSYSPDCSPSPDLTRTIRKPYTCTRSIDLISQSGWLRLWGLLYWE